MYLYRCIRDDILSGEIKAGEKLPSKRSFAENLGISVITVENAYAQLISEGYIYSLPKKGFFAAEIESGTAAEEAAVAPVLLPDTPQYFADFSSNRTDPENFPFTTWAKLMRENISEKSAELMINAPCGGVPALRQAIAAHLHAFRGIDADPNHIIVGAGTEYLYGLLIQLLGFDKTYALEDPGYKKVGQIFESHGVQYVYTPMDADGVDSMVFDEIDTGVSGRMAQVVGEKMCMIACNRQVLCVTHLPQIAALGNAHFLVEKRTDEVRTETLVIRLDDAGRVRELSRLVGGAEDSASSLSHAAHMLEEAVQTRRSVQNRV